MAEFLTTKTIQSNLENIITEAKKQIVIVSPYIRLSSYYYEHLAYASKRGALIRIIYGKNELHPNELGNIASFKNVELYYYEQLHAKCYLNESKMIITSMNLYEASERNREMGVLLNRSNDKEMFDTALREIELIMKSPQIEKIQSLKRIKSNEKVVCKRNGSHEQAGHCIRCNASLKFNTEKPYCSNCYSSWAEWGNPFYTEKYCHCCGDHETSSMEYPQCYECYTINKYEEQFR
jgi:hypothetical protein